MYKGLAPTCLCLIVLFLQECGIAGNLERGQARLYKKLFGNGISRRMFLPRPGPNQPVQVHFKFELINIKEVNAKEQFISVYGWVQQKWQDPCLIWNSSEYEGIKNINVDPSKIWVPDILLYNNVDAQDHTAGGRSTYTLDVDIDSNGTARWSSPALFKCVCNINVTNFPFDEQRCYLKFGSWSLDSSKVGLLPWKSNGKSTSYVSNGEWELLELEPMRNANVTYTDAVGYDDVTIMIYIGRNFFNYCVNLIIPCALISCMIFLGFILPPESGERIGLSITVLLAMTVFQQLTSQIFPSFDFPLLAQYYFATSFELSLALGASALVINFSFRKTMKMPRCMRKFLLVWMAKVVFLQDEVNRSRPKRPDGSIKTGDAAEKRGIDMKENRKEDRLAQELKEVINNPSQDFDFGGTHFVNTRNAACNGAPTDPPTGPAVIYREPEPADQAESKVEPLKATQGGQGSNVIGEDGKELGQEEVAVREWEWKQATRVLDRFFFWTSVFVGVVTILAVFPRAPRLQRALGLA